MSSWAVQLMQDQSFFPANTGASVERFYGAISNSNQVWFPWRKPIGKTMAHIILIGHGGQSGAGAIGAASTAGGGGGGGSGGQSILIIPLSLLPDVLYYSLTRAETGAGNGAFLCIFPNNGSAHTLLQANSGSQGGNAAGATAGTAGSGGSASNLSSASLGGMGIALFLSGQSGTAGGSTGVGVNLTLPSNGLIVTGGTGGGGLPAAVTAGNAGGNINAPASPSLFSALAGGIGAVLATDTPGMGANGLVNSVKGIYYNYGGTGSGSTNGSATTLVQARGGDGAPGCGAGGSGGALTGSTVATTALGGQAFMQITCW